MKLNVCALVLIVISTSGLPAATAQEAPPLTVFQQIFPQPTGQNGYEEIVAAGELLAKSGLLLKGEQDGPTALTLAQKRAILADPPVRDALLLFRQGIAKSLHAPRDRTNEAGFKAFSLYRRMARVLAMEQYVLCADGRVGPAIDSLQDGLRLGYAIQQDALIGGLVGVAIDSLLSQGMERRLDQFAEKDCRRVIQLARAWLAAPDPAFEAMGIERDQDLENLKSQLPPDANFPREQVLAAMRARFDYYAANLSRPAWERKPPPPPQGNPVVADYVNALGKTLDPAFEQAQTIFVRDQSRMQMLGVRAAIRLYRWEHDALPGSLEPLQLGALLRDPFSGKPFSYRVLGLDTYEMTTEGARAPTP